MRLSFSTSYLVVANHITTHARRLAARDVWRESKPIINIDVEIPLVLDWRDDSDALLVREDPGDRHSARESACVAN